MKKQKFFLRLVYTRGFMEFNVDAIVSRRIKTIKSAYLTMRKKFPSKNGYDWTGVSPVRFECTPIE